MLGAIAWPCLADVAVFSFTARPWELGWQGAVVLGGAIAMSSTAIVVKLMAERLELDAEHGKRVLGILLFQDLAVVPLLVHHSSFGGTGGRHGPHLELGSVEGRGRCSPCCWWAASG
jgi:monovalent cation:H+ antiporter-2, CPA2 family